MFSEAYRAFGIKITWEKPSPCTTIMLYTTWIEGITIYFD